MVSRGYLIRDGVLALVCGVAWHALNATGGPLWSEEDVYQANVWHPWFYTDEHYDARYFRHDMTQRERSEGLARVLKAGLAGFAELGVPAFLESSTLIGHVRHGGMIPWDTDADFGILEEDCMRTGLSKEKIQDAIPSVEVVRFACQCNTDECVKNGTRVLGLLADRTTGSTVDIFVYRTPKTLRPWQSANVRWLERSNDAHADYTFPYDTLMPLKSSSFLNATVLVPNKPREFLEWEYGPCLGIHVVPYGIFVYSPTTSWGYWLLTLAQLLYTRSLYTDLGALLPTIVLELFGYSGVAAAAIVVILFIRRPVTPFSVAMIALAVYDLRGCVEQLGCDAYSNFIAPSARPRAFTICMLGKCMDFHVAASPVM